ncbi:MAG: hypothetical protein LBC18_11385 [Opitutaceae bacterium]|nr:hypothetical protein [Opitutaceae bacterium]
MYACIHGHQGNGGKAAFVGQQRVDSPVFSPFGNGVLQLFRAANQPGVNPGKRRIEVKPSVFQGGMGLLHGNGGDCAGFPRKNRGEQHRQQDGQKRHF